MATRSTKSSPQSRTKTFGALRFNAPGSFEGLDFSTDDRSLIALVPGDERTRLCQFRVENGELEEERSVAGRWNAILALPDGGCLLWSRESVVRLDRALEVTWTIKQTSRFWRVSPDGRFVATYGSESVAHVFDGRTGKRLHKVKEPKGEIFAVAFSVDGSKFATGGEKGIVRVFDWKTKKELAQRTSTKVLALAFSPDGEHLAGGHGNGEVRVWQVPSLKPLSSFRGASHRFLEDYGNGEQDMGPAGCRWLAFASEGTAIVSAGNDRFVRWWNLDGSSQRRVRIHPRHSQDVAMAIAHGGHIVAAGTTPSALSVWNASGEPVVDQEGISTPYALLLSAEHVLVSMRGRLSSWSRDGRTKTRHRSAFGSMLASLPKGKVLLADSGKVSVLDDVDEPGKEAFELDTSSSRGAIARSHDAKLIAVPVDTSAEWWDWARGVRVGAIPHDAKVSACAFGPKDEWIVTVSDAVRLWWLDDAKTPFRTVPFEDGEPEICGGVAVSPRGWIAVSIDRSISNHDSDSALVFIDPRSGKATATLEHPQWRLGQVAFVDDTRAVVVDSAGTLLMADAEKGCWLDLKLGDERAGIPGAHDFEPLPLSVSEDGSEVAYVDASHNISIYEVAKSEAKRAEPFVLDRGKPPAKKKDKKAAGPAPMFEKRLVGTTFMFIGNFNVSAHELRTTAEFREETVRDLGGVVTKKPKDATHFVVARRPYVAHKPTAVENTIRTLLANGQALLELNEKQMVDLLLPTLEESRAMLRGEIADGIERWNRWRSRHREIDGGFARLTGIDLANADLRKAQLSVIHFEEAKLAGVSFAGVDLYDCVFRGADLRGADLDGANCGRVEFAKADLREAKLGADLGAAKFQGADLRGADLRNADLSYCDLKGAKLDGTKLPKGFVPGAKKR